MPAISTSAGQSAFAVLGGTATLTTFDCTFWWSPNVSTTPVGQGTFGVNTGLGSPALPSLVLFTWECRAYIVISVTGTVLVNVATSAAPQGWTAQPGAYVTAESLGMTT